MKQPNNPSLYEAAMVDGATSRQQFFKITLPLLRPILQFTMVTSAIGGLQMYDIPKLFNEGGPVVKVGGKAISSTQTVVMLIKTYASAGSSSENFGRASAYSVILFIATLCVSMIFYKLTAEKN
jgi:multiple sugar transport system permease protein